MFLGLSQQEMAEQLSCDYSTYGKLENGRTIMDVPRLRKIAAILKTTTQDLLGDERKTPHDQNATFEVNIKLQMTVEEFIRAGLDKKLDPALKDYIVKNKKSR